MQHVSKSQSPIFVADGILYESGQMTVKYDIVLPNFFEDYWPEQFFWNLEELLHFINF